MALKYDGKRAPTVAASGLDEVAEEIIRIAREHDVPLYENAELAGILARLDLDEKSGNAVPGDRRNPGVCLPPAGKTPGDVG